MNIERWNFYGGNPRIESSHTGNVCFWKDVKPVFNYCVELESKVKILEYENKKLKDLLEVTNDKKYL